MDLILDIKIFIASLNKEAWLNLYVVDNEFQKYAKLESSINLYIKLFQVPIECNEYIDYPLFDGKYSYRKHKISMKYKCDDFTGVIGKNSEGWYKYDLLHRDDDFPAYIHNDGSQIWYKDGKINREGDLPAVIHADGSQKWYKDGKCHRDLLPARINTDGSEYWYKDGIYQRNGDLPAIILADDADDDDD